MAECKQLRHKVNLQQRFSAGNRDTAAVFPVAAVPAGLREHILRCPHGNFIPGQPLSALRSCRPEDLPGLRVMAVPAAHRAALHKNNEAYTRPVDRAKRFDGIDVSFRHCLAFAFFC